MDQVIVEEKVTHTAHGYKNPLAPSINTSIQATHLNTHIIIVD